MRSSLYLSLAIFSTYTFAQTPSPTGSSVRYFSNLHPNATNSFPQRSHIVNELESLATSLYSDPVVSSDIAFLEAPIPTSIASAVESKVESDVISYAADVIDTPEFTSAVAALESVVPSSVSAQIASAPAAFIISLITETRRPPWVSAIPTPVANYIFSVANYADGIVASDLADALPTPTARIWRGQRTGTARDAYPTAGPGHRGHKADHDDTGYYAPPYPTGTGSMRGPHHIHSGTGVFPSGTGVFPSGTGVFPSSTAGSPSGGAGADNSTASTGGSASTASIVSAASPRSEALGFTAAIVVSVGFLLLL